MRHGSERAVCLDHWKSGHEERACLIIVYPKLIIDLIVMGMLIHQMFIQFFYTLGV